MNNQDTRIEIADISDGSEPAKGIDRTYQGRYFNIQWDWSFFILGFTRK